MPACQASVASRITRSVGSGGSPYVAVSRYVKVPAGLEHRPNGGIHARNQARPRLALTDDLRTRYLACPMGFALPFLPRR